MQKVLSSMLLGCVLAGCAGGRAALPQRATIAVAPATSSSNRSPQSLVAASEASPTADTPATPETHIATTAGPWIGAAGASSIVGAGVSDTVLGVWVDVPSSFTARAVQTDRSSEKASRAHAAVALVIDTSGSMSGSKIDSARTSARALVQNLADGDIVAIETFSDVALERIAPTPLSAATRPRILSAITELTAGGATNLFEGLRLGESRLASVPQTYAIRRVVVISDGLATVGPSSPEILGAIAARGADQGVQVTAIGVGLDYDENTLNTLAVRSSGRLYHMTEPREMTSILAREMELLSSTMATHAFVEVVPAAGVTLLGADGVRADWSHGGSLRIPLGTLFGGQHREMLLRLRVHATGDTAGALASVRLHFRDPSEGSLERVQEVVARYDGTGDRVAIEEHRNDKTQSIMAVQSAAQMAVAAAQEVNQGRFDFAERGLASAEAKLRETASRTADIKEKQRVLAAADRMSSARRVARDAAAPPSAAKPSPKRAGALEINSAAMHEAGY